MSVLIIVRHGQSVYNLENRFTGWQDVALSPKGRDDARQSGQRIRGEKIDITYTSALQRARETLLLLLESAGFGDLPLHADKALNERSYGDLEGLNKGDVALKLGVEQLKTWRRSYDVAPPNGESFKTTIDRVQVYFEQEIAPQLRAGKNVLIVAHGNSLRALVLLIEKLSPEQIQEVELPILTPKKYTLTPNLEVLDIEYLEAAPAS